MPKAVVAIWSYAQIVEYRGLRVKLALMLLDSLLRDEALANEDINQTLERLSVLLWQQIVVHGYGHEVDEAAVQLEMAIQVPEWVLVVVVVQVGITSEHLFDDTFDIVMEIQVETRGLANPFVSTT